MTPDQLSNGSIDALRAGGRAVYTPGDTGYDEARAAWNLVVDQHPALVLMARNAANVRPALSTRAPTGWTLPCRPPATVSSGRPTAPFLLKLPP